jgi:hypothetical protein
VALSTTPRKSGRSRGPSHAPACRPDAFGRLSTWRSWHPGRSSSASQRWTVLPFAIAGQVLGCRPPDATLAGHTCQHVAIASPLSRRTIVCRAERSCATRVGFHPRRRNSRSERPANQTTADFVNGLSRHPELRRPGVSICTVTSIGAGGTIRSTGGEEHDHDNGDELHGVGHPSLPAHVTLA